MQGIQMQHTHTGNNLQRGLTQLWWFCDPQGRQIWNQLNIHVRFWSAVSDSDVFFFPLKRFNTSAERVTSRIQSLQEARGVTTPWKSHYRTFFVL